MSSISRNEPCPCGSGKKYKKCCLGKDEKAAAGQRQPQPQSVAEADLYIDALTELTNRANDLIRAGEWDKAFEACGQLQERFPGEIDAEERFGEYYKARGDFVQAKAYAQAALQRAEADPGKYHTDLMECLHEEIEYLEECIRAGRLVD